MKSIVRSIMFLVFLLTVMLFTGCQTVNSIVAEPKLSLSSVDIGGISFNGVDLIAKVDVENPNGFSIPLPNIDWEFFIDNVSFIQGSQKNNKTLKSNAKSSMDIPFTVGYEGLYRTFVSLINTKEAPYAISMGLSFPIPILENKVYNLGYSGVLPLPLLPKLSPGQMRISKMDLTGIELACGINVENPNIFPIPFPKIDWDYGVNGVSLFKSSLVNSGEIAAGAADTADIVLNVSYTDIFKLIDTAINANEAKSNLSLSAGFPYPGLDGVMSILDIPGTIPLLPFSF